MFKELYGIVGNLLPAPKEAEEKENKEVAKEKEEKDKEEKDQVNFVKEGKEIYQLRADYAITVTTEFERFYPALNVGLKGR